MMAREKKQKVNVSFRLEKDLNAQLEQFCEETGATKTGAVENILKKFLNEYFAKPRDERSTF